MLWNSIRAILVLGEGLGISGLMLRPVSWRQAASLSAGGGIRRQPASWQLAATILPDGNALAGPAILLRYVRSWALRRPGGVTAQTPLHKGIKQEERDAQGTGPAEKEPDSAEEANHEESGKSPDEGADQPALQQFAAGALAIQPESRGRVAPD